MSKWDLTTGPRDGFKSRVRKHPSPWTNGFPGPPRDGGYCIRSRGPWSTYFEIRKTRHFRGCIQCFPPVSTLFHLYSAERWKVGQVIPSVSTSFHLFPPYCTFFRTLFFLEALNPQLPLPAYSNVFQLIPTYYFAERLTADERRFPGRAGRACTPLRAARYAGDGAHGSAAPCLTADTWPMTTALTSLNTF